MMPARHVVLVTYGEPVTPAFLDQLAYSWRILLGLTRTVAPIPAPLVPVIAVSRAVARTRSWTAYDYRSPLEPLTRAQARLLADALQAAAPGHRWVVHVAYEFRRPLLAEALAAIPDADPVWVVPMYATDSAFTHALSRAAADAVRGRRGPLVVLDAVSCDELAELSAAHVLARTDATDGSAPWRGRDVALVLAAHGTLLQPPRPIDTGLEATEALCRGITDRLTPHFGLVVNGWLNHTRGGKWTDPPIDTALESVAAAGYSRVVYYPYGFLADNAESELEGRVALGARSGLAALHLPCLNESPSLLESLARQVAKAAA